MATSWSRFYFIPVYRNFNYCDSNNSTGRHSSLINAVFRKMKDSTIVYSY